jgi:hypothetical protein
LLDASGNPSCDILRSGRRRKRLAISLKRFDPFIDNSAQLGVDFGLVAAVAARPNYTGTLTDETLIFVRPLHELNVAGTVLHFSDSSIAALTLLVQFRVRPEIAGNCHSSTARMFEIAMISFAASIQKPGSLQIAHQLSNLTRHEEVRTMMSVNPRTRSLAQHSFHEVQRQSCTRSVGF